MSKIELQGIGEVLNLRGKIAKAIVGVPEEVRKTNRRWVGRLRGMLIAHSSGPPGPDVDTGAYNAAYVVETTDGDMSLTADNPSPQSNRLEYGFVGRDSLGRMYYQAPRPHFRPTGEEAAPAYASDIAEAFPRFWTK